MGLSKQITIRFPDELLARLEAAARRRDRSLAWLVRKLVSDGLAVREKERSDGVD
jgi:predicted transcriptional regulator